MSDRLGIPNDQNKLKMEEIGHKNKGQLFEELAEIWHKFVETKKQWQNGSEWQNFNENQRKLLKLLRTAADEFNFISLANKNKNLIKLMK